MAGTVTSKLVQKISVEQSDEEIKNSLHTVLDELKTIYSYLVYAEYKNEVLIRWKIEYTISQDDRYNTLDAENLVDEIFNILKSSTEKKVSSVIGYKQPSLEIQLEVFEPFINKLAIKQVKKWPCLEYDDAHQMCQLTMLNLYRKGYYLHPSLMERCYENDILLFLRKDKYKPEMTSISKVVSNNDDNTPITLGDMLPDIKLQEEKERQDEEEFIQIVFSQVKEIIVELIGERQFEQLMRDYANKHTTSWSRKKMQQIKETFKTLGISWKSFDKYK